MKKTSYTSVCISYIKLNTAKIITFCNFVIITIIKWKIKMPHCQNSIDNLRKSQKPYLEHTNIWYG